MWQELHSLWGPLVDWIIVLSAFLFLWEACTLLPVACCLQARWEISQLDVSMARAIQFSLQTHAAFFKEQNNFLLQ